MPKSQHREGRADGKHQTRLAFSPLPDGSPGKQSAPEPLKDRVAGVSIDWSPRGRKETLNVNITLSSSSSPLSSPEASSPTKSQPAERFNAKDSNTVISSPSIHTETPNTATKPRTRSSRLHGSSSQALAHSSPPSAVLLQRELFQDEESGEEAEEEDDDIVSPASKRRRLAPAEKKSTHKKPRLRRHQRASSFIDDESDGEDEEEAEEDEEESDVNNQGGPVQKRKRRDSHREREDLEEDLEFLKRSESPTSPSTSRKKETPKNARQQALEALRKRRTSRQEQSSPQGESTAPVVIKSSDDESSTSRNDVEDLSEAEDEFMNLDAEELDRNEEDFIVEDDEGQQPVALPLLFSNYQSMKTKELFKFVIEWMVQKKLNPGFAMDDEVYKFAFRRTEDFANGLAAKFRSSAWTADFTKALRARPDIEYIRFAKEELLQDKCDACNRGNHPATYEVTFKGAPYNKNTLEPEDEEHTSSDADLPDEDTVYSVGKFCMANSRVAHSLAHWKYHLNDWTVDYLKAEGHCTADKLVERDSWSTARRRNYANDVVDKMAADGQIKELYRDFKNEIEQAHLSAQGRYTRDSPEI